MSLQLVSSVASQLKMRQISLRLRLALMSAVPIAALALGLFTIFSVSRIGSRAIHGVIAIDAPLADLVRQMQIDILEIQDAYTDLSAIRARDEMEAAFATAEQHRQTCARGLERLRANAAGDSAQLAHLQSIAAALDRFCVTGRAMAQAFVTQGTEAGYAPMKEFDDASEKLRAALEPIVQRYIGSFHTKLSNAAFEQTRLTNWSIIAGAFGAMVCAGLAVISTRSVSNILTGIAAPIEEGAEQTAGSAAIVANTSKQLAERATAQAATLEETSATLEEISSMTQRNSESAHHAKTSTTQARQTADEGVTHMAAMERAMHAIQGSSAEISKIIKSIDEISFQTNILALNAAVEAARAGEAGAGFAVVAEEVRNLAQRSAHAARETSEKIEAAVAKSAQGAQISSDVAKNFQSIQRSIAQVDRLVAEIASASVEQGQGLNQLRQAVAQLDQVSQANAATAEESASAAEELNANASSLRLSSHSLIVLLDPRNAQPTAPGRDHAAPRGNLAASVGVEKSAHANRTLAVQPGAASGARIVQAVRVIPEPISAAPASADEFFEN